MMTATAEQTLYDLRKQSGMTIAEIVSRARDIDPQFPTTHVGLIEIEQRGTRDYWKIHALAAVYGVLPHDLARIARPRS